MNWLVYGAYGYTGQLVVDEAMKRGEQPILAGRNEARIRAMAEKTGLQAISYSCEDEASIVSACQDIDLVVNCAGPFVETAVPIASSAVRCGAHYLDVSGEIPAFQSLMNYDGLARRANTMIVPGTAFIVAANDYLANKVAERIDGDPVIVSVGISSGKHMSRGTAKTTVEILRRGGLTRREGKIVAERLGSHERQIRLAGETLWGASLPTAELVSVAVSTRAPTVQTYFIGSKADTRLLRAANMVSKLLHSKMIFSLARAWAGTMPGNPSEDNPDASATVWAECQGSNGQTVSASMTTTGPYQFTAEVILTAIELTRKGSYSAGWHSPTTAFGFDLVESVPGTHLTWIDGQ